MRPNVHDSLSWLRILVQITALKPPVKVRPLLYFLGAVLAAGLVVGILLGGPLPREAVYMAGIFILAAILWITEALPLYATAILIFALEIVLLANPGAWPGLGFETGSSPSYRQILTPISDPIIVLFFGGLLMARAAIKEGVDKAMAGVILRLFGERPLFVMLGLMLVTAFFSMWMSNTAATAMMITLVVPMLAQLPQGDPFRKGIVMAVPFAANIGGMGTPISSPPNAVAIGFLEQAGYSISFLQWMLISIPLMLGLLLMAWLLLWARFRPKETGQTFQQVSQPVDARGWYVIGVIGVTILLWMTDRFHGLPTAAVALVPTIAFTATGLLGRREVNSLEWHILILIMGGIALGAGMQLTGLDQVFVRILPLGSGFALAIFVAATLIFSTFMSNTAAANLFLPIGISFATAAGAAAEPDPYQIGISIALIASAAMALPISTPPNTIAYAQGEFDTRDIALSGGAVSLIAIVLIITLGPPIIRFWMALLGGA